MGDDTAFLKHPLHCVFLVEVDSLLLFGLLIGRVMSSVHVTTLLKALLGLPIPSE